MRIAAFVVGVIGGVVSSLSALLAMFVPVAVLLTTTHGITPGETDMAIFTTLAAVFCLLAIVGAVLVLYRPRASSLILATSAVGLTISVVLQPHDPETTINGFTFPIVFAPLFLVAAALAFFVYARQRSGGEEYRQQ